MADRIDMQVHVPPVHLAVLAEVTQHESSAVVRARVQAARTLQRERYRTLPGIFTNAHVSGRWLEGQSPIDAAGRRFLISAAQRLGLSARGYHRVLKVARTVADLEGEGILREAHVAGALRYRAHATSRRYSEDVVEV